MSPSPRFFGQIRGDPGPVRGGHDRQHKWPTPSQWPNNPNRPVKVSWSDTQVFLSHTPSRRQTSRPAGPVLPRLNGNRLRAVPPRLSWGTKAMHPRKLQSNGFSQTAMLAYATLGAFLTCSNIWEWVMDWKGNYLNGSD